ncbi:MAG: tRNA(Met) cytidine acetyltransferase [Gammaproteobacteria bacterium]|nr:tRNA(Met) cytidine acetyltransferase [Gammaproteobacteria bacterium]
MERLDTESLYDAEYGAIKAAVLELQFAARRDHHRRVLWLAGDAQWGWRWAETISRWLENSPVGASISWVSISAPDFVSQVNSKKTVELLGTSCHHLVFNAHDAFDPDVLGLVTGTILGGGLFVFLSPEINRWQLGRSTSEKNQFLERLTKIFTAASCLTLIKQLKKFSLLIDDESITLPLSLEKSVEPRKSTQALDSSCTPISYVSFSRRTDFPKLSYLAEPTAFVYTENQKKAVELITHVVTGHRRRPLILTSDRGRGKSTALGLAAAKLLLQGVEKIIVTAPRPRAVDRVFKHAKQQLPDAIYKDHQLYLGSQRLVFVAPDELVANKQVTALLMVDEAAAIPIQMLSLMLKKYSRIVFSSTVHGYEGTGRGFAIRFHDVLNQSAPGWQQFNLHQPVRWNKNDPVESMVFSALLLNVEPVDDATITTATIEHCIFEKLDRAGLSRNESDLSALFSLLVLAHYRTRPRDLQTLLDAEEIEIYVVRYKGHIIATTVLCAEGGLDPELAEAVYNGQRRLPGHLICQTLAAHTGIQKAPVYRWRRIIRIATHPAVRRRGLAAELLKFVEKALGQCEAVAWGASFGANADVVQFWQHCGFTVVRAGINREHASGSRSVLMLKPLTETGIRLCLQSRQRFQRHYCHLLSEPLADMDAALALILFASTGRSAPPMPQALIQAKLDTFDWQELRAFAYAHRGYEVSLGAIWTLVSEIFWLDRSEIQALSIRQQHLLLMKVLQKQTWAEVAAALGYSGRKETIRALRDSLQALLVKLYCSPK